jgi:cobalt-zinc-cadmium resistance protein CzcA
MLKSRSDWPEVDGQKRTYPELVSLMIAKLERELPGQTYLASQPIQMRFNELLEGTRADVSVKIFGPDLDKLVEYAKKTQDIISKVPGAGDVEVDLAGTSPVLRIEPNEEKLRLYNASVGDVLDTISIALGGEEVGHMYESEKKFPIVVRLSNELRADLDTIKDLPVGIGHNTVAPLGQLTDIGFKETYGSVNRENSNRRTAVLINLRDRDTKKRRERLNHNCSFHKVITLSGVVTSRI